MATQNELRLFKIAEMLESRVARLERLVVDLDRRLKEGKKRGRPKKKQQVAPVHE